MLSKHVVLPHRISQKIPIASLRGRGFPDHASVLPAIFSPLCIHIYVELITVVTTIECTPTRPILPQGRACPRAAISPRGAF